MFKRIFLQHLESIFYTWMRGWALKGIKRNGISILHHREPPLDISQKTTTTRATTHYGFLSLATYFPEKPRAKIMTCWWRGSKGGQTCVHERAAKDCANIAKYARPDIWNAVELRLFFSQPPRRSLSTEKTQEPEKEQTRITALRCGNRDSSKNLQVMFFGDEKRSKPFFEKYEHLPGLDLFSIWKR